MIRNLKSIGRLMFASLLLLTPALTRADETGLIGSVVHEKIKSRLYLDVDWGAAEVLWNFLTVPVGNEDGVRLKTGNNILCEERDDIDPIGKPIQRHRCWFQIDQDKDFVKNPERYELPKTIERKEYFSAWESWVLRQPGPRTVYLKIRRKAADALMEMNLPQEKMPCAKVRIRPMRRSGPSIFAQIVTQCKIRFSEDGSVVNYDVH